MANNFKVWDENNTNVVNLDEFASDDSQRGTGFKPNTGASSSYVNSGLREATLVSAALMQMLEDNGVDISSLNFQSTLTNVVDALKSGLQTPIYRHNITMQCGYDSSSTASAYVRFSIDTTVKTPTTDKGTLFSLLKSNAFVDDVNVIRDTDCIGYLLDDGASNAIVRFGIGVDNSVVLTYLNANTSNKVTVAERKITWTTFKIFSITDNVVKYKGE